MALPCQSFDEFPRRLSAKNSTSLLKCWTGLWHPSLLSFSNARPDIWSVGKIKQDIKSSDDSKCVVSVPRFVVTDFDNAIGSQTGTCVAFRDSSDISRADAVASLMQRLKLPLTPSPGDVQAASLNARNENSAGAAPIAQDFFALGYAWLQVRLMTLHVRYSTNLDNDVFDSVLMEAASAWSECDYTAASEKLTRCFDLLLEEKNNYYSVEPDLIDLVLVERRTIDSKLDAQLLCSHHISVLCSGQTVEHLKNDMPETCNKLKSRLADGSLTVAGGVERELPSSLIPQEGQLRQFRVGRRTLQSILGTQPETFARRQFGLTSMTPGFLEQLGYEGACHMTFDGGNLPNVHGSTMRWVGEDAQTIPALASIPIDANDSRSFLGLGIRIAKQIDNEHVSTVVFAHWPERSCETFEDLIRLTRYGALFGDFVGLNDYFQAAYDPGYGEPFTAEQYECEWLARAVQQKLPDPISRFMNYWRLHQHVSDCRSLMTVLAFAMNYEHGSPARSLSEWKTSIERMESSLDSLVDFLDVDSNPEQLVSNNEKAIKALRSEMVGHGIDSERVAAEGSNFGCMINLSSFSRTAFQSDGSIVELPAMGWVSVASQQKSSKGRVLGGPPVDDGLTLRNEFFQIIVDPESGGIRSLKSYNSRQNQASQRLSVRFSTGKQKAVYADMRADNVSVERVSATESRIISIGQLINPKTGQSLCGFTQMVSLRRADRFSKLLIQLTDVGDLPASADHYICSRMAWHDESSPVFYGSSETRSRSTNAWIEAPAYIRVEQLDHAVTLLTNGIPWHRRSARNLVDSVLVVSNERQRQFQLSIGLDCPNDLSAAMGMFSAPRQLKSRVEPFQKSGWLFHFSSKSIVGVFNEPILIDDQVAGVRWRLLETQGRRGKLKLSCPFEVTGAERMMFDGRSAGSVQFDGRVVEIEFTRNEYFEVCIYSSPRSDA